jgi:hypothetical protein
LFNLFSFPLHCPARALGFFDFTQCGERPEL